MYILTVQRTIELVIVEIAIKHRGPPFGQVYLGVHRDTGALPPADIAFTDNAGLTLLFKSLREKVGGIAIIKGCGQEVPVGMGKFQVMGELGLKIRIA